MVDVAGHAFDDEYEVAEKLGEGMMASVHVAVHRQSGAVVVCKMADREEQRGERACELMRHECGLLYHIGSHPNVVQIFNFFAAPHCSAIVMDLVRGGDCQQLLQCRGALAEPMVQSIMSQLCAALAHLHGHGLLHRDVKLENVLCDASRTPAKVKLCDLGHSAHSDAVEQGRVFHGTPAYAAPEVAHEDRQPVWTSAADVWSAGVVMYALLTNMLPFDGDRGWEGRPADLTSSSWWQVSTDAKLLLHELLDPRPWTRATLEAVRASSWAAHGLPQATGAAEPAAQTIHHAASMPSVQHALRGPSGSMPHSASWHTLEQSEVAHELADVL